MNVSPEQQIFGEFLRVSEDVEVSFGTMASYTLKISIPTEYLQFIIFPKIESTLNLVVQNI